MVFREATSKQAAIQTQSRAVSNCGVCLIPSEWNYALVLLQVFTPTEGQSEIFTDLHRDFHVVSRKSYCLVTRHTPHHQELV